MPAGVKIAEKMITVPMSEGNGKDSGIVTAGKIAGIERFHSGITVGDGCVRMSRVAQFAGVGEAMVKSMLRVPAP